MRNRLIGMFLLVMLGSTAWLGYQEGRAQPGTVGSTKVYVGLFKDNAVAVVDAGANRLLTTIPVPRGPHGLVITPDGRKVYVSSDGASTVSVIDTATDRVVGTVEVGPNPHGLAMSRDGRHVLVLGFGANQALVVDTTTDTVSGRFAVAQPHNGVLGPDGRVAYVGSQQQGATAIVILDLAGGKEIGRMALDKTPRALDLSPDGKWLYVTVAGVDAIQVLDTASRQLVGQVPVGASPHIAVFTPGGERSLAVSQGPGELAIIETARRSVKGVVAVGRNPHWVAVSGDGRMAYVANEGSNDVSIVDLDSGKVVATVPVGNAPRKIAAQPGPAPRAAGPGPAASAAPRSIKLGNLTFSDHGTRDAKGQAVVDIEADDYYFKPTFVRGAPGQTLTLEVENESGTLHNLSIPGQRIDRDIPPRSKTKVDIVFPASGVVGFSCKFHGALGMNGQLLAGDAVPGPLSQIPVLVARSDGDARTTPR